MSYFKIKRYLDVIISFISLVLLSPVFLIVGLTLLDKKEKVIFKQKRVGLNGETFNIYKFRTIKHKNGKEVTTKYCQFLRKFGIDELPQLINIIKGDMSIIGPRPRIKEYYNHFNEEQKSIFKVSPGIITPVICECKENANIVDKIDLEINYANNVSFKTDREILKKCVINIKKIIKNRQGSCSNKNLLEEEINTLISNNKEITNSYDDDKTVESLKETTIMVNYSKEMQIKSIANFLELELKEHNLKTINKSNANAFNISDNLVYLYPLNDGMPTCHLEFYKHRKLILDNRKEYSQISNLDDILLKIVRIYDKSLDNGIVIDPYYFMLKLTDPVCENYHGTADLVITEKAIRNQMLNDDNFDEANKYFINHFLDHFIGWNFGVSVNRSQELREELERLNEKVIDMGIRKYAGTGFEVYGVEDREYNGLQHYKLPIEKDCKKNKIYILSK